MNEHNALVPRDHWLEESEKQQFKCKRTQHLPALTFQDAIRPMGHLTDQESGAYKTDPPILNYNGNKLVL